ncbi:MAG: UPF0175 family protein [Niabella sp.]
MNAITLYIPDHFGLDEKTTIRFLAAKLYESGKLSLGQAAEMADLSKSTFAELLTDFNVPFINYQLEDVLADAARL